VTTTVVHLARPPLLVAGK